MRIEDIKVNETYWFGEKTNTRTVLGIGQTHFFIRTERGEEIYNKDPRLIKDWVLVQKPDYRWLNIYKDSFECGLKDSKELADHLHDAGRLFCFRIDLNTGDIMKEEI